MDFTFEQIQQNYKKKNFFKYLSDFSQNDLEEIIQQASDFYYNDKEVLSDVAFDKLIDYMKKNYKNSKVLKEVGAEVKKNKVKLPYYMGSLNKLKSQKEIELWLKKNPSDDRYFVSEKLDGVSCLYYNGFLRTRGNAIEGQDITYIKKYINNIPKKDVNIEVRGELVIQKQNFEKYLKNIYSNPRNAIPGIIREKKINPEYAKYIDFVPYQLFNHDKQEINENTSYSPIQAVNIIQDNGFQFVGHILVQQDQINKKALSLLLNEFSNKSLYLIDGLVITTNTSNQLIFGENPKYSFAFKELESLDYKQTTITKIVWNVNKDKILVPTIFFDTIVLEDTKINSATAHNASYVVDNGLGTGAVVEIYKSGHIIPAIKNVIKKVNPELPTTAWEWNETHKNIIITQDSEEYQYKVFENFFTKLKIHFLNIGTLQFFYKNNINTIGKVMNIQIDQLNQLPGFQLKKSTNVFHAIHNAFQNDISIEQIIIASNQLGKGISTKKLYQILEDNPSLLKNMRKISSSDSLTINGQKTKDAFYKGWNNFIDFCIDNNINLQDY